MAREEKEEKKDRGARKRARGGRARGGKADNLYNAKGSPEGAEAEKDTSDGFKRGGRAEGEKSKERGDKRARGGRLGHRKPHMGRFARGGSPFSSAHSDRGMSDDKNAGHEGEKPGREP